MMPMQGTGRHVCVAGAWGQGPLEASSSTELAWDGLIPGDQEAHTACGTW